jgi:hypothetical protein
VAPSLAHILRDSEEEAIRALLLALRHVHWPRLPVWFPLHPPVPAILPVQGPFPTTGRAAPHNSTAAVCSVLVTWRSLQGASLPRVRTAHSS